MLASKLLLFKYYAKFNLTLRLRSLLFEASSYPKTHVIFIHPIQAVAAKLWDFLLVPRMCSV